MTDEGLDFVPPLDGSAIPVVPLSAMVSALPSAIIGLWIGRG